MPDTQTLTRLLEEAAEAHHDAEKRLPEHKWSRWYGTYIHSRLLELNPDASIVVADTDILAVA